MDTPNFPNHIEEDLLDKLEELLSQDQFELLPAAGEDEIRLIYLMNDAVESFLVFEDAHMTGTYTADYEGELEAELSIQEDGRYVLVVVQGDSVCTILFRNLSMQVFSYNYGKTGHVWMKGSEELRQLEYWAAILQSKRRYLGEEFCSAEELRIADLEEFPPLNCCCYPAVPKQYFTPREDAWIPSEKGIRAMEYFAGKAGDERLLHQIKKYRKSPSRRMTRRFSRELRKNSHTPLVELLYQEIEKASSGYPERTFTSEEEIRKADLKAKAEKRKRDLEQAGKTVFLFYQEPFVLSRDSIDFKAHLLIISKGLVKRKVQVEALE